MPRLKFEAVTKSFVDENHPQHGQLNDKFIGMPGVFPGRVDIQLVTPTSDGEPPKRTRLDGCDDFDVAKAIVGVLNNGSLPDELKENQERNAQRHLGFILDSLLVGPTNLDQENNNASLAPVVDMDSHRRAS